MKARDTTLRFRDGVPADAQRIADLGRQTFTETFDGVYKRSDLDSYLGTYFSPDRVGRDLENPDYDYRVAEAQSGLAGYAKIGPVHLQGIMLDDEDLQLHRLYVREARQGVGVGGILLSWCIGRAKDRGANDLWLGVSSQNKKAIGVYEGRGFEAAGTHTIQVGETRDEELIMRLSLSNSKNAPQPAPQASAGV